MSPVTPPATPTPGPCPGLYESYLGPAAHCDGCEREAETARRLAELKDLLRQATALIEIAVPEPERGTKGGN